MRRELQLRYLPPGRYDVHVFAPGMATRTSHGIELLVGGVSVVQLRLSPAGPTQTVNVSAAAVSVETQTGDISNIVTQQAIQDLPLNGRSFTDLALLSPDVTQDPRGLTSDSNGDLSVGGVRGFQNTFLVDGTDNNNSFLPRHEAVIARPTSSAMKSSRNSASRRTPTARSWVARAAPCSMSPPSRARNDWHGGGFYYFAIATSMPGSRMPPNSPTTASSSSEARSADPFAKTASSSMPDSISTC